MMTTASDPHRMQCMEVWGGNEAADHGVEMPGLDAWVYSRPHAGDDAGGDVYYLSSCATGRITRLLVADVSGHGEAVRGLGSTLRQLMRRHVNRIDQRRFVRAMNEEFVACSDDAHFATAAVGTYFAPTRTLTMSLAGHPPPLFYEAARDRWSFLGGRDPDAGPGAGLPLGVAPGTSYEIQGRRLAAGDLVLYYTDSLTEAPTDPGATTRLGLAGLKDLVEGLDPTRPEALIPAIIAAVDRCGEGLASDDDDVTLLLIRPNDRAPRLPWLDRLLRPLYGLRRTDGEPRRRRTSGRADRDAAETAS